MDASTSVTLDNWDKTIDFVKKFSQEFDVSPTEVHFGVIRFSWKAHFDIKISDPNYWNQKSFQHKVDTLKYVYGKNIIYNIPSKQKHVQSQRNNKERYINDFEQVFAHWV